MRVLRVEERVRRGRVRGVRVWEDVQVVKGRRGVRRVVGDMGVRMGGVGRVVVRVVMVVVEGMEGAAVVVEGRS
jgi:hypothetical protein